jgi:hypothetical protein
MTSVPAAPTGDRLPPAARRAPALLAGLACLAAAADVLRRTWLSDDAFVSFRYVEQLLAGNGLVFNAGERVEGYTNFLWTMLLAGGAALGLPPTTLSLGLGVACFAATFALLLLASARLGRELQAAPRVVPVAGLAFLAHQDLRSFATGGLETMLFALLATALAVAVIEARGARGWLLAGALGTLAALTRPDGLLLYAVAGAFALADAWRARRPGLAAAAALPLLVVFAPYWVWRWRYYGWPFPNTYYAKSGDRSWWSQGGWYLGVYFACYWGVAVAAAVAAWRALRARGLAAGWTTRRAPLVVLALGGSYLAWVAKVGGDFMFARFCLPVTPLLLLGFEWLRVPLRGRPAALLLPLLAGAALLGSPRPAGLGTPAARGLSDEPNTYPRAVTGVWQRAGEHLRGLFAGRNVRVMIGGGQLALAYYGRFPYVLEGATGLTDAHLAHLPIVERGRPGHEKPWTLDVAYVLSRRIDFVPLILAPPVEALAPGDRLRGVRHAVLGEVAGPERSQTVPVTVAIATYRRELWEPLRGRPGVRFVAFDGWLDEYLRTIDARPRAELAADYAAFREYYFAHNADPARERRFLERLRD